MRINTLVLVALLCSSGSLSAQTTVDVKRAELSVPFGTAVGTVVLIGDYIVFIDEQRMDSSFAIARGEIQSITNDGNLLVIETRQPVRDRSGERSRFSVRLTDGSLGAQTTWLHTMANRPNERVDADLATRAVASSSPNVEQLSFPAEYSRRFGRGSRGRLLVTEDLLAYESTDHVNTSRRWQLNDIKEIKLKNPYELEIDPFVGGTYNLRLGGAGMDNSEFNAILDRITAARIAR